MNNSSIVPKANKHHTFAVEVKTTFEHRMVGGRFGQVGACEAGSRARWRLGGATFKTASKDALTASPDLIPVEPDL